MSERLRLEVVTPYGSVFNDEVDEVVAPGEEGEFGVLPGHLPFITTLKIGILTYKKGGSTGYMFVNTGYAEVKDNKVLILVDSAEKAEDIDIDRAREALQRAEQRLKTHDEVEFARAQAALERATTRIEVAKKAGRA